MPTPHDSRATRANNVELDAVLAIQLTVAWAGEKVAGESRLGWWQTELTDADAGGDFLGRLLPRTHAWAGLIAVREAARRVDEAARRRAGRPDSFRTLFHFGFDDDERLDARIEEHRPAGTTPPTALGLSFAIRDRFDRDAFTAWLEGLAAESKVEIIPGGRKLLGQPKSPLEVARRLARALLPLAASYPLPCYVIAP